MSKWKIGLGVRLAAFCLAYLLACQDQGTITQDELDAQVNLGH